jgi:glutamyl-tRNA synthetase
METLNTFDAATAEEALRAFSDEQGVKAGLLINASRTMLTGQAVGPSMFDVFDIIGCERAATRLRSQVPWNDFSV